MNQPSEAALMQELIDAMGKAAGAAGQLVHSHGNPNFIPIRAVFESAKDALTSEALRKYDKVMYMRPL